MKFVWVWFVVMLGHHAHIICAFRPDLGPPPFCPLPPYLPLSLPPALPRTLSLFILVFPPLMSQVFGIDVEQRRGTYLACVT